MVYQPQGKMSKAAALALWRVGAYKTSPESTEKSAFSGLVLYLPRNLRFKKFPSILRYFLSKILRFSKKYIAVYQSSRGLQYLAV